MSERQQDEDLVLRIRAGDEAAFTDLYRRWQGPIYRFAYRMSGRAALAEDATQEVFMALIQTLDRYDPRRGPLGSYLYGMARNHVLRRLERERPYLPIAEGAEARSLGPATDDPQAEVLQREQLALLRATVLSLPAHYREAIVLCDLQLLSYDEAAAAIGCAVGTLRSRLHRGRALLSDRMRSREVESPAPHLFKVRGAMS
jgi:RNA polymerase sigma-70 factor (ECF subfamily)